MIAFNPYSLTFEVVTPGRMSSDAAQVKELRWVAADHLQHGAFARVLPGRLSEFLGTKPHYLKPHRWANERVAHYPIDAALDAAARLTDPDWQHLLRMESRSE